ncbi:DUF1223 domain-containing protein [Tropicimonas sediminicola]|uniref:DUF1223 domain-containing protein n=1 Tax=Tropicimonas sediminicola TaxID=1031541 RepID=A0A239JXE3_9RHOB|nr:DUF1223 domain-containing protein [Tropicimonas sediminicola]SNT10561.1 hypothetical protein SAMN05421757_106127 [Tropicimonas sediminicola]
MKLFALAAGLAAGLPIVCLSATAQADENRVVIELFTSQGCSSCPPADELLERLAERDDVLPLALHVDYWDYIGWADSFARPEHTRRQKAYARIAGSRSIYTPQMIIGGVEQIVGTRPMEVADAVMRHVQQGPAIDLDVERDGDTLRIMSDTPATARGPLLVQLVRYMPHQVVEIGRGENAGRTLTYTNIVTEWSILAEWTGAEPLDLSAEVPGPDAVAVIVQKAGNGRILAAADLR